jgi:hypothetical protein
MNDPWDTFKRSDSSEAELREAAKLLDAVVEPPSFWSAIANDASMPIANRKLALVELVRRHVVAGTTTVGAFARMLDGAPWLNDSDITLVTSLAGKVPVKWSPENAVAAITLPGGSGAIYVTIAGRHSAEEIASALCGMSHNHGILSAAILDTGVEIGG